MLIKDSEKLYQKLPINGFLVTSHRTQKLTNNIWFTPENQIVQYKTSLMEGLAIISRYYSIDNFLEILKFLRQHQNLIAVLVEAYHQIRQYLPLERLRLKLYIDPESSQWEYLLISICSSPDSVDEAWDKLNQFENNWWNDASIGVATHICINLEFE
jgi:hypothetical protein